MQKTYKSSNVLKCMLFVYTHLIYKRIAQSFILEARKQEGGG